MRTILDCPAAHSLEVDADAGGDGFLILVGELHVSPEPVDHVVDQVLLHAEGDGLAGTGEHVDMLRHVLRQIDALFQALHGFRGAGRLVGNVNVSDPV